MSDNWFLTGSSGQPSVDSSYASSSSRVPDVDHDLDSRRHLQSGRDRRKSVVLTRSDATRKRNRRMSFQFKNRFMNDSFDSGAVEGNASKMKNKKFDATQAMLRYALLFINFTFLIAALLMIMAGVVTMVGTTVQLCKQCGQIAQASITVGLIMWLGSLFAFNAIRTRNIFFLMAYIGVSILSLLVSTGLGISAIVVQNTFETSSSVFGAVRDSWEQSVESNRTSHICALQKQYNCSGLEDGCCDPVVCYNASNPPAWVNETCPYCPGQKPAAKSCSLQITENLHTDLAGFIVINWMSTLLIFTGIGLAIFVRKMR